jgi:hypothetical protein
MPRQLTIIGQLSNLSIALQTQSLYPASIFAVTFHLSEIAEKAMYFSRWAEFT